MNALEKAIKLAGGQSKLATAIGEKAQTVSAWKKRGGRIPVSHVIAVERVLNGQITAEEMCPERIDDWLYMRNSTKQNKPS